MTPEEEQVMRDELWHMTMRELRALARDEGICLGYDGATKTGTVNSIVDQRRYREENGWHG